MERSRVGTKKSPNGLPVAQAYRPLGVTTLLPKVVDELHNKSNLNL